MSGGAGERAEEMEKGHFIISLYPQITGLINSRHVTHFILGGGVDLISSHIPEETTHPKAFVILIIKY